MPFELYDISIPEKGGILGTNTTVTDVSIPAFDKAANIFLVEQFSLPYYLYCVEVVDADLNPIENAEITFPLDPNASFFTDVNGQALISLFEGDLTISKAGFPTLNAAFTFDGVPLGDCLQFILTKATGMAVKLLSNVIPEAIIPPTLDLNINLFECTYFEPVFANVGGESYQNDKNSFLLSKRVNADTITFKLCKDGSEIATISDDTYGTYYASFPSQPLYTGFIIEWEKVLNIEGTGSYKVIIERDILGVQDQLESQCFRLMPYSDALANGTVRVETIQTGNIISSDIDYTDLLDNGWYQSFRMRGFFGFKTPRLEIDNYLDRNYELRQIQDKIVNEWILETEFIPSIISNQLTQDNMLANQIFITDYNIQNHEIYRSIQVYPSEFEEVVHPQFNKNVRYRIKFTDKFDNVRKRNF